MKKYFKTTMADATDLKVDVYYHKGGYNLFTYEHERTYYHEQCLFQLNRLNHASIENLLQIWTPRSYDYKGYLWKASIIAEVGRE